MSSSNYPPGAEHDPRAPWNEPDPPACLSVEHDEADCLQARLPEEDYCDPCRAAYLEPDKGPDPDDLRDLALDREDDQL